MKKLLTPPYKAGPGRAKSGQKEPDTTILMYSSCWANSIHLRGGGVDRGQGCCTLGVNLITHSLKCHNFDILCVFVMRFLKKTFFCVVLLSLRG